MKIIGLAGGIGSGKSTVAQYLAQLGAAVMDLDKAGHEVQVKGGEAYKKLVKEFGEDILTEDREIDRARLGKIVFGNPEALKRLNAIVHPAIDKMVEQRIHDYGRRGIKVLVLEAAAMLEAERNWLVDEIWVTAAPEDTVIRRIEARPGYSAAEVKRRINSQMTNEEHIKKADVVIQNDGTLEELREKVKTEWQKLQGRL